MSERAAILNLLVRFSKVKKASHCHAGSLGVCFQPLLLSAWQLGSSRARTQGHAERRNQGRDTPCGKVTVSLPSSAPTQSHAERRN